MNKVILMGRLTAAPELKETSTGTNVCRFTIAVDRKFTKDGNKQVDFISCTAWRQTAEFICKFFKKGSMICVIGNIQTGSWQDQSGQKHYTTDVMIDEVYFTGSKQAHGTDNADYGFDDFSADISDAPTPF